MQMVRRREPKKSPGLSGAHNSVGMRGSWVGCLLAADLAADAATPVDDLATALGPHAGTEANSTAAFDVADSSWVVYCHR